MSVIFLPENPTHIFTFCEFTFRNIMFGPYQRRLEDSAVGSNISLLCVVKLDAAAHL